MPLSPFKEALDKLRRRLPVGADLGSSQWADVPVALRERAFFSARVTNLKIAQDLKTMAESILNPIQVQRPDRVTDGNPQGFVTTGENLASARTKLKEMLQRLGYNPGDKAGTIQDLSSDGRLNLVLKQNVESAQGFGNFLQGTADGALDVFPAQELFRAEERKDERPWPTRWMQAGGQIFGGRMIALKADPIWEAISAFGVPWPPFDFNSGMWVRDIGRDEAIELGLLTAEDPAPVPEQKFNDRLQARVEDIDPDLLASLQQSFGAQFRIADGIASWTEAA